MTQSGHCCPCSIRMPRPPASRNRSPRYFGVLLVAGLGADQIGISFSLSAGMQAGSSAFRAPLTNNSASFSA